MLVADQQAGRAKRLGDEGGEDYHPSPWKAILAGGWKIPQWWSGVAETPASSLSHRAPLLLYFWKAQKKADDNFNQLEYYPPIK